MSEKRMRGRHVYTVVSFKKKESNKRVHGFLTTSKNYTLSTIFFCPSNSHLTTICQSILTPSAKKEEKKKRENRKERIEGKERKKKRRRRQQQYRNSLLSFAKTRAAC